MAASIFPSNFQTLTLKPKTLTLTKHKPTKTRVSIQPSSALSDPFVLQIAESFEDSVPPSSSPPLQKIRDASSETLLTTPWPTRRDEPYRFTDTSFIKSSQIQPVLDPSKNLNQFSILTDTQFPNLDIINGFIVNLNLDLSKLPNGVFIGSVSGISDDVIMKKVFEIVADFQGDLFWSLNGVGAPDLTIVFVPAGCRVENPVHLRYYSSGGNEIGAANLGVSNPRVLVVVEEGGEIGIIEEFLGGDESRSYWANAVIEVVVGKGAKVVHSYIQSQSMGAAHIKWTSVRQESESTYELVEVSTGGKLSRHNLHVQQVGPDTVTELSTFHLSAGDQTQDLHSRLVLDHPRAYSRQLHKCIVAHSLGQAVFDGNVKVNRYAQQTDAGQLTRSLLLEPRATVNIKPNLQIIADDVRCSHGAAISDLDETQLFYFQARGIDLETARGALIFSFGSEVIERLPYPSLQKKVENHIKQLMEPKLKGSSSSSS